MGLKISSESILFFDTAPFIYFFENNSRYVHKLSSLLDTLYTENAYITTSLITYIEITTVPAKANDEKTLAKYRQFFTNSARLSIQPMNLTVAEETVKFRACYNLKTPDAIQLASASYCGADYVITNDRDWQRVEELAVVLVDDL